MKIEGLKSFSLDCPAEANWAAARKEANRTKPEQAATVLTLLYEAAGIDTEGIHERLTRDDGGLRTEVSREAVKIGMSSALDWFRALYYNPGDSKLFFEVDRSKWCEQGPKSWRQSPDACALMLLEYGVLQAAGFTVSEQEYEGGKSH